jgi:hypothetical protein
VAGIGAVEDAAAGGARAEFVERLLARGDDVGIEGHAHVIVGAEQDRALAVADRDGRAFDRSITRLNGSVTPGFEQRLALLDQRIELGEEVDEDVELVLDVGDEIHHHQRIPFEIAGEAGLLGKRGALLVERGDQARDLVVGLVSIGHSGPFRCGRLSCQANAAGKGLKGDEGDSHLHTRMGDSHFRLPRLSSARRRVKVTVPAPRPVP